MIKIAELTVSQIIKVIIGLFVVVALVFGFGLYFDENFLDFFEGIGGEEASPKYVDLSGYEKDSEVIVLENETVENESSEEDIEFVRTGKVKLNFVPIKLR